MPTPRFYCPTALRPQSTIELPAELAHYALRVLRLKPGADIILFDGRGGHYTAVLQAEGKKAFAQIGAHEAIEAELPGNIVLVQGIASGDKMDWVIEKAVEMGAGRVVPLAARRSVLQLSGERLEKRLRHWVRVAQAASEQCGRNRLMTVDRPINLADFLATCDQNATILFCDPDATQTLQQSLPRDASDIILIIGPEGGWAPEELSEAARHALIPVQFGRRILRTETAGTALIAAVSALLDWH